MEQDNGESLLSTNTEENINDTEGELLESGAFSVLPDEIVSDILFRFGVLDLREILRISMVSRRFFYLSTSFLHRMNDLDLQPHFQIVSDGFLQSLAPKLRMLQRASLSWTGSIGSVSQLEKQTIQQKAMVSPVGASTFLLNCGRSLTTLRLACCSFVTNKLIALIADTCLGLEDLDLQRCDQIEEGGFDNIKSLACLQRLNLYNTRCTTANLLTIVSACSRLQHLNLGHCNAVDDESSVVQAIADNCSELVSLDLWFWRKVSDLAVTAIFQKCRELREIDLGWSSSDIRQVLQQLDNLNTSLPIGLEKLFLTANKSPNDSVLLELTKQCKHLRQLDVLNSKVTPSGVEYLLEHSSMLEFLDISFCSAIDADQAEEWNLQYSHVDVKRSYQKPN